MQAYSITRLASSLIFSPSVQVASQRWSISRFVLVPWAEGMTSYFGRVSRRRNIQIACAIWSENEPASIERWFGNSATQP